MKTFCFKLYHSDHNNALMRQISIAGLIYNHCIALHRRYYRLFGKYIHKYQLQKHITKLKRTKRFRYMRKLGSQAVQDIAIRIDRAYKLFWRNLEHGVKSSPPKFKKVRKYKSFTLKQAGWKLDERAGKIYICGHWYKYFKSREIFTVGAATVARDALRPEKSGSVVDGTIWTSSGVCQCFDFAPHIKTLTVKRDNVGDIYVYLVCDNQPEPVEYRSGDSVGFGRESVRKHFGLAGLRKQLKFLTASDGRDIDSPDFFMLNAKRIKTKCRNLSRKKDGSNNRERARLDLARAYRKMENQRKNFHFKTARRLCEQYAVILNIKGMARLWGRKIHSLGFSEFVKILHHEALKAGTRIVSVDRYYPSSQLGSECGYKIESVKDLRVREWDCPSCHTHHDRDRNAARNILRGGASSLGGGAVRPEKSGSVVEAKIPLFQ